MLPRLRWHAAWPTVTRSPTRRRPPSRQAGSRCRKRSGRWRNWMCWQAFAFRPMNSSNQGRIVMSTAKLHHLLVELPDHVFGRFASLFLLATRVWVSWEFLKSGWIKITSWQNTVFLFHNEYQVPVLPPTLAAVAGTAGELVFPALFIAGVAGRLSAAGLFAVNAMAVVSYAHVLLTEGFEAAVGQH